MTATANGAPAARVVAFTTEPDPEPPERAQVSRDPRPGESLASYVVGEAREKGIVPQSASLTAEDKERLAARLLEMFADDTDLGGSPSSRRIQAAFSLWQTRNPQVELGNLGAVTRDLAGRWTRGLPRVVAILCERLAHDPAAALSDAERVALAAVPELAEAVRTCESQHAEALERVRTAAERAQADYPSGRVGPPIVREETS